MEGRSGWWRARVVPALLLINGLAVLFFRHTVSMDGPLHLLHAQLIHDHGVGHVRSAGGIWAVGSTQSYDPCALVLAPFVNAVHPFVLHTVLMCLSTLGLAFGAWRLASAYAASPSPTLLVLGPLSFSFVWLLGLFNFLLAAGVAMAGAAWWVRSPRVGPRRLLGLLAWLGATAVWHVTGAPLLFLLVVMHEVAGRLADPNAWRARWAALPRSLPASLALGALALLVLVLLRSNIAVPAWEPEPQDPWKELLTLRTLLLLDVRKEAPMLLLLGLLLVVGIAFAAYRRRGTGWRADDALPLTALSLLLVSLFFRTARTDLLYIPERTQWLALVLLVCWSSVRPPPLRWMRPLLVALVAVHVVRVVYIERRMHGMLERDRSALAAAAHFAPHAIVLPLLMDDRDWTARHLAAYPAMRYDGLLYTGLDHVQYAWYEPPHWMLAGYPFYMQRDLDWLRIYNEQHERPPITHVLLLGRGSAGSSNWSSLRGTLAWYYGLAYADQAAQVWTLRKGARGGLGGFP